MWINIYYVLFRNGLSTFTFGTLLYFYSSIQECRAFIGLHVTSYVYLLKYNFEVFYSSISIFCYFLLSLYIILFTPLSIQLCLIYFYLYIDIQVHLFALKKHLTSDNFRLTQHCYF